MQLSASVLLVRHRVGACVGVSPVRGEMLHSLNRGNASGNDA